MALNPYQTKATSITPPAPKIHLTNANTVPNVPSSPVYTIVPVALSYDVSTKGKRLSSPTRASDSLSSPPKKRQDNRPSPRHRIRIPRPPVCTESGDSPTDIIFDPSVIINHATSFPSERAERVIEVINNIRDKPINTKVAVLKHIHRRTKASPTVRKRKLAPKKKNQLVKLRVSQSKQSTSKSNISITKSPTFFVDIRPYVFVNSVGYNSDVSIPLYTGDKLITHNKSFHEQLKFRFAAT